MKRRKVTTTSLGAMKRRGEKITMITAYDATFARLLDDAGADILLVGDSLGMVICGEENTLSVTMDAMTYHCAAVSKGRKHALVVGDMPFLSFQISPEDALRNAGRLLSAGHAEAVKIEGGRSQAHTVRKLVGAGIPVMGHLGLTPQSVHQLGGFRTQGQQPDQASAILEDAKILEDSGCFSLVLECIPGDLAREVSQTLTIPTIGIGAGPACDGQVLVCYDMLGLNDSFRPKFLKQFALLADVVRSSTRAFIDEVRNGQFPGPEQTIESAATNGDSTRHRQSSYDITPLYGSVELGRQEELS
ncbi:MAG: 3-methyl-2-oxobutanoate hydroxymethyltransferase [Myxococcales bacterium]|nr:3-methyl-2-oxobutanoate hydroxymethyltransferase [Myxococcales bacterium]